MASRPDPGERIVVTGAGVVTGLGAGVPENLRRLGAGGSAPAAIRRFDASTFPCGDGACLEEPDAASLGLSPRDARAAGFPGRCLLQAAREAVRSAGLAEPFADPSATAFFAAMEAPDPLPEDLARAAFLSRRGEACDWPEFYGGAFREIHPLWPLAMLNNVGFAVAAQALGVWGENAVFSPAADMGARAVAEAAAALREGRCTVALAGGATDRLTPLGLARAHLLAGIPEGAEPAPDGAVLPGEAAGVLVLEREADAAARGVPALAGIAGWAFGRAGDGPPPAPDSFQEGLGRLAASVPAGGGRLHLFAGGGGTFREDVRLAADVRQIWKTALNLEPVTCYPRFALGNVSAAFVPVLAALLAADRSGTALFPARGEGTSTEARPAPAGLPALIAARSPEGGEAGILLVPGGTEGGRR